MKIGNQFKNKMNLQIIGKIMQAIMIDHQRKEVIQLKMDCRILLGNQILMLKNYHKIWAKKNKI